MKREIVIGGKQYTFTVNSKKGKVLVEINGQSLETRLIRLPDGRKLCLVDGKVIEWSKSNDDLLRFVRTNGSLRYLSVIDPRKLRRTGAYGGGIGGKADIKAPMPGKVVKVLVEDGQEVESDQGIVVLEAMKMENELRSPVRGTVTRLSAAVGDAVDIGHIIAVIEPSLEG